MDEFVVAKSIRATTALTELGLIQKTGLTEFIMDCACYLNHPNLWIRHETCGLISTAARSFGAIDVQCKIMPAISNHLKCPLIQVEKEEILLDCLHPPIPRHIFDTVVCHCSAIHAFIRILEQRKVDREKIGHVGLPQYPEMDDLTRSNMAQFFRRFTLNELIEMQLLSLKHYLIKLNRYKMVEKRKNPDGKIILEKRSGICHEYVMG